VVAGSHNSFRRTGYGEQDQSKADGGSQTHWYLQCVYTAATDEFRTVKSPAVASRRSAFGPKGTDGTTHRAPRQGSSGAPAGIAPPRSSFESNAVDEQTRHTPRLLHVHGRAASYLAGGFKAAQ